VIINAHNLVNDWKECFNCPYGNQYFPSYAENIPEGPTCKALSELAAKHKIYLIGGMCVREKE
jgi:omega-amidase